MTKERYKQLLVDYPDLPAFLLDIPVYNRNPKCLTHEEFGIITNEQYLDIFLSLRLNNRLHLSSIKSIVIDSVAYIVMESLLPLIFKWPQRYEQG